MPVPPTTEFLLFVDRMTPEMGECCYSACELNRSILSWKHGFPLNASILGTNRRVDVSSMAAGKKLSLRSGPFGTDAVIGGKVMPRLSRTEIFVRRIENRCEIRLQPAIQEENLPTFVGPIPKIPPSPVRLRLMIEGDNLFSPYLPLIQIQDGNFDRALVEKFYQKLGLPCPVSSFSHKYDLESLAQHLLTHPITLPIVMMQSNRAVMGAAVVHSKVNNHLWDVTILSSEAVGVVSKGCGIFCITADELTRIAAVA